MPNYEPLSEKEKEIKIDFFQYYLDHCCVCTNKDCICKAITTKDTLCDLRDMTRDKYKKREYQEAIDND